MHRQTFTHKYLDAINEVVPVPEDTYSKLEQFLNTVKDNINPTMPLREKLIDIGIYARQFFSKSWDGPDEKYGDKLVCRHLSALYKSACEEMGIDARLVKAPFHIFVRVSHGKETMNWETISNKEKSDEEYIKEFNIHPDSITDGIYLSRLNKQEEDAMIYRFRGHERSKQKCLDGAIIDFDNVIKLFPNNLEAYYVRGLAKEKLGDVLGAEKDLDKYRNWVIGQLKRR